MPPPCVVEQVARNKKVFESITNNKLNSLAGFAIAYASSTKVETDLESIAIKGDWIPLPALLQWTLQVGDIANVKKLYYTVTVKDIEYALMSMHVSSRQTPE